MIFKWKLSEFLYFSGALVLLVTGIGLKSVSAPAVGLYILYTGRRRVSPEEEFPSILLKSNLFWDLMFMAVSVLMLFSALKVIFNIFFHNEIIIISQWLIPGTGLGILYFEILFRITGDKKNRLAVLLIMLLLILFTAAFILGGLWLKTDLILGFLSLTVTVIISFRKAYIELTDILL